MRRSKLLLDKTYCSEHLAIVLGQTHGQTLTASSQLREPRPPSSPSARGARFFFLCFLRGLLADEPLLLLSALEEVVAVAVVEPYRRRQPRV